MRLEGMLDDISVREETAADRRAIDVVNISAFANEEEANLIAKLRDSAAYIPELSLVAELHTRLVGHIMLSAITLTGVHGELRMLELGPMSVVPSQSHRGIGSALVRAALAKAGSLGYPAVVVIGHPEYYRRFGFVPLVEFAITCALPVPEDAVSIKELVTDAVPRNGKLRYPQPVLEFYARTRSA